MWGASSLLNMAASAVENTVNQASDLLEQLDAPHPVGSDEEEEDEEIAPPSDITQDSAYENGDIDKLLGEVQSLREAEYELKVLLKKEKTEKKSLREADVAKDEQIAEQLSTIENLERLLVEEQEMARSTPATVTTSGNDEERANIISGYVEEVAALQERFEASEKEHAEAIKAYEEQMSSNETKLNLLLEKNSDIRAQNKKLLSDLENTQAEAAATSDSTDAQDEWKASVMAELKVSLEEVKSQHEAQLTEREAQFQQELDGIREELEGARAAAAEHETLNQSFHEEAQEKEQSLQTLAAEHAAAMESLQGMDGLQAELARLKAHAAAVQQEVHEVASAEHVEQIATLTKANEQLKVDIQYFYDIESAERDEILSLKEKLSKAEEREKQQAGEISELKTALKKFKNAKSIAELRGKLNDVKSMKESIVAEVGNTMSDFNAQMQTLLAKTAPQAPAPQPAVDIAVDVNSQMEQQKADLQIVNDQLSEKSALIAKLEQECAAASAEAEHKSTAEAELSAQLSEKSALIAKLEQECAAAVQKAEDVVVTSASTDSGLAVAEESVRRLEARLAAAEEEHGMRLEIEQLKLSDQTKQWEQRVAEMEAELVGAREEAARVGADIKQFANELQESRVACSAHGARIEELDVESRSLHQQLEQLSACRQRLQESEKSAQGLKAACGRLEHEITNRENKLHQAELDLAAVAAREQVLIAEKQSLIVDKNSLAVELQKERDQQKEHQSSSDAIMGELATIALTNRELEQHVADLQGEIAASERSNDELRSKQSVFEEEQQSRMEKKKRDLDSLRKQNEFISSLQGQISELEKKVRAAQERDQLLSAANRELTVVICEREEQLAGMSAALGGAATSHSVDVTGGSDSSAGAWEEEIRVLKQDIVTKSTQIQQLNVMVNEHTASVGKLSAELEVAKKQIDTEANKPVGSEIGGGPSEVASLREQLKATTGELLVLQQRVAKPEVDPMQYAELEEERRRLQSENDYLEKKVLSLEARIADSIPGGEDDAEGDMGMERDVEAGAGAMTAACFISTPKRDGYRKGRIGAPLSLIKIWTAARTVLPAKVFDYVGETPPVLGLSGQFVLICYFILLQLTAFYVWF